MAVYEVTGEDGKVYEVDGEDAGSSSNSSAPAPAAPQGVGGAVKSAFSELMPSPGQMEPSGATLKDLGNSAMSPVPGSMLGMIGKVLQEPSKMLREKMIAEGHPVLGELAGILTDPGTYAGGALGGTAAEGAVEGVAEGAAGMTESAYPKLAGKMMEIFKKPSTMLPAWAGGPATMKDAKLALDAAEAQVLKRLKATSLEAIDDSAKTLTRAKSGLSDDIYQTVDTVRQNQTIAQNPQLAGKVAESKIPVEKLIQAEKALKARISKLWDEGLGDHAQAMQQELDRVSKVVDAALPQLKDARAGYHLSKLREEVTSGGIMNTPAAGFTLKRLMTTPGLVSYGMAGLGAARGAAGVAGNVAGAASNAALERLTRRYLPRKE